MLRQRQVILQGVFQLRWLHRTEPDYSGIFYTKKSVSYKSTRDTKVTGIYTVGKILHT